MVVDADDGVAAFKQAKCQSRSNKAGRAGDEDFHLVAPKQVAGVNLVSHIGQGIRFTVGDDDVGLFFESGQIVDDA